jgi:uncharacterized protein
LVDGRRVIRRSSTFSKSLTNGEIMADSNQNQSDNQSSGKQGFASMDPDRQREIASQGGKASRSGSSQQQNQSSDDEDQQDADERMSNQRSGTQGGTPEQHADAGRQSHKNST